MKSFTVIFALLILNTCIFGQEDLDKIRDIIAMKASSEKIQALHSFQSDYPQSQYFNRASQELFNTFLKLEEKDSAIYYANQYLQAIPEQSRTNAYNSIAYTLAENETGLDSALAYSTRAVDMAANNPRYLKMFQDTKAYVLYKKGDYKSALELQAQAAQGNEDDPEYMYHLALYQAAAGDMNNALKNSLIAALNGDPGEAIMKFNEWADDAEDGAKEKITEEVIQNYITNTPEDEKTSAKSRAASFMAQAGVNMEQAKEWAQAGLESINNKTMVEDYINYKKNYAIILAANNNYEEAVKHLEEVRDLVDPWSGDFWLTLGSVYEKLGNKEKALNAYVSGLIGFENPMVRKAANALASDEEIESKIDKLKDEYSSVETGEYEQAGESTGKVVLAELFTGAECGPCVAADRAFDELSEHYPRTALAILEYHVHIPGPDPLTNDKSIDRYRWYGGNFGTPTVFFEGTEQIVGGGPKYITANRFNVYDHAIQKYMDEDPDVELSGMATLDANTIDIKVSVNAEDIDTTAVKPVLHIALAEKSVKYVGANGVDKHIFVVRDLVNGVEGIRLTKNNSTFDKPVNFDELSKTITDYLTDPTETWSFNSFGGWRLSVDELDNIDKKNLAVIAWVQDDITKKVIQAHYFDVN